MMPGQSSHVGGMRGQVSLIRGMGRDHSEAVVSMSEGKGPPMDGSFCCLCAKVESSAPDLGSIPA